MVSDTVPQNVPRRGTQEKGSSTLPLSLITRSPVAIQSPKLPHPPRKTHLRLQPREAADPENLAGGFPPLHGAHAVVLVHHGG